MSTVNTPVLAETMLFLYSTDGINYKAVVCEGDSSIEGTMEVIKDQTKCGVLKGTGPIDFVVNENAVVNDTPDADEGSYNEVQTHFLAKTYLYMKYTNADESIYHSGRGWFTKLTNTNAASGNSKFSFTFEVNGDVSNTPES